MESQNLAQLAAELGTTNNELISKYSGSTLVVDWATRGLKIVRFRLLSDPSFPWWDISYCWGELNGVPCRVELPFDRLPKHYAPFLIAELNKAGLNGKRLGIWDAISSLV